MEVSLLIHTLSHAYTHTEPMKEAVADSTKTIRCAAVSKTRGNLKFLHLDASYLALEEADNTVRRKVAFSGIMEVSPIRQARLVPT